MKEVVKPTEKQQKESSVAGLVAVVACVLRNISNNEEEVINCFEALYDPFPILCSPGDELCALEFLSLSLPTPSSPFFLGLNRCGNLCAFYCALRKSNSTQLSHIVSGNAAFSSGGLRVQQLRKSKSDGLYTPSWVEELLHCPLPAVVITLSSNNILQLPKPVRKQNPRSRISHWLV